MEKERIRLIKTTFNLGENMSVYETIKAARGTRTNRSRGEKAEKRAKRRVDAEARQKVYDAMTPTQKLAVLDAKFGVGKGATRQRVRLAQKDNHAE